MPSAPTPDTIAALLERWRSGDPEALGGLMDVLYAELRALAHAHMRRERSEHTLQTSALINELYLRLVRQRHPRTETRAQFFGIATHIMRRILVDYARSRAFQKRGSGLPPIRLDDALVFSPQRSAENGTRSPEEASHRVEQRLSRHAGPQHPFLAPHLPCPRWQWESACRSTENDVRPLQRRCGASRRSG